MASKKTKKRKSLSKKQTIENFFENKENIARKLKPGDTFLLYGLETAIVISIDEKRPETGLVYEYNGKRYNGLLPWRAPCPILDAMKL